MSFIYEGMYDKSGKNMYQLCKNRGHWWELRAASVKAVVDGEYDVVCDRCGCYGEKSDLKE